MAGKRQLLCAVSACLCGRCVRYDGGGFDIPALRRLAEEGMALPVCPECLGGLSVPRPPAERQPDGRVLARGGEDVTAAYRAGAEKVLALCREQGIRLAILKENSPSCGVHTVYDGSFSGRKIRGEGETARLLRQNGIAVVSESEWDGRLLAGEGQEGQ